MITQKIKYSALLFFMSVTLPLFSMDEEVVPSVGIYWGAFNPLTDAHRAIIIAAARDLGLDQLCVVVNDTSYKDYMFSLEQRIQELKTMLVEEKITNCQILSQRDEERLGFTELQQRFGPKLVSISGYDSYKSWSSSSERAGRALWHAIIVVPRGDEEPILMDDNARLLRIDEKYRFVSSTQMRQKIMEFGRALSAPKIN